MRKKKTDIMKILQESAPGLVLGGLGAKIVNNKVSPMVQDALPESIAPLADLTPAILGLYLAGQGGIMGKAGEGMIAVAGSDVLEGYVPGISGLDDNIADDVDDIIADDLEDFEEYDDDDEDEDEDEEEFLQEFDKIQD